ncbi:MAG TPA: hypothetical protein VNO21_05330, partial [Polyangiaceae bacterium]|nr:hypothetical protein [Polyangiaceae bacterium]
MRYGFLFGLCILALTAGCAGNASGGRPEARGSPRPTFDAEARGSLRHINPPDMSTPHGYSHVVEAIGPGR